MRVISDSGKEQSLLARFGSGDERPALPALELGSQGCVACEEKSEVALRVISDSGKEQSLLARFGSGDERPALPALELGSQGCVACEEKSEVACV